MKKNLLSTFYFLLSRKRGQSLIEVLIAAGLGALFVLAAATIIAPAIRISSQAGKAQVGAAAAKKLADNVRVWADGDWHKVDDIATTSASHYYLNTSVSPFTSVSGDESLVVSSTTYTRYFYVDNVNRNTSDLIVTSGGSYDPSTKKVTIQYSWTNSATNTLTFYITRNINRVFQQTDWSGGAGQEGPVTSTASRFSTSSKANVTTTTGSIYINL